MIRVMELGFRGTPLRKQLLDAVLRGEKTATSSLREQYEPHTKDGLPEAGERFTLAGCDDEPAGIVEIRGIEIVPVAQVSLEFARDEGEGFESVGQWRAAHERFWAGSNVTDETLVVCERFRLLPADSPDTGPRTTK